MNRLLILVFSLLLSMQFKVQAQNLSTADLLDALQKKFAGLTSYEASGKYEIIHSDEILKLTGKSTADYKNLSFTFKVYCKGARIHLVLNQLNAAGIYEPFEDFTVGDKQFVEESLVGERVAKMKSIKDLNSINAIRCRCPILLEYSFLNFPKTNSLGVAPLDTSVLLNPVNWTNVNKYVASIKSTGAQTLVTFGDGVGNGYSVAFAPNPNNAAELLPEEIQQIDIPTNSVLNDIKVLDRKDIVGLGSVATKLSMDVSLLFPGKKLVHVATWNYEIDDLKVNPQIGDDMLDFDPTTAGKLWDLDRNVQISIPR